ncbi:hypothetical protein Csa_019561 [Cucumis sativus]|nr:hypothetical protein Csa_019561 [Cucumis sativus]
MDAATEAHNHHMHGMTPPPDSSTASPEMMHHKMMMHMTFFWGTNAEILFHRWPGERSGMYALALIFIFVLAFLVEWLTHCRLIKEDSSRAAAGLIRTLMHTVRVGLAYLVMLAVMSFNVGVLLVAIGGHCLGFFLFGSKFFKRSEALMSSCKRKRGNGKLEMLWIQISGIIHLIDVVKFDSTNSKDCKMEQKTTAILTLCFVIFLSVSSKSDATNVLLPTHDGMHMDPPPPPIAPTSRGSGDDMHTHDMMSSAMHMTFFWGKNTQVLFSGWLAGSVRHVCSGAGVRLFAGGGGRVAVVLADDDGGRAEKCGGRNRADGGTWDKNGDCVFGDACFDVVQRWCFYRGRRRTYGWVFGFWKQSCEEGEIIGVRSGNCRSSI